MSDITTFKLPNRDALASNSGKVLKLLLLAGAGFAIWTFMVPILLTTAMMTVKFIATAVVALFMVYTCLNPKFWRALQYYSQWIAEKMLNGFIEMNPFMVMQNQVDKAEEDRQSLHKQGVILKGQESKLENDIAEYNEVFSKAKKSMEIVQREAATTTDSAAKSKLNRQYQQALNEFTNAKDYVDSVKPIKDSITQLVQFADRAYEMSGDALDSARFTIKTQKAKWDAVTTGSKAMAKAQAAFEGRPELNQDSLKAMEYLRKDIGNKIGAIRESIKITSNIMDNKNLADAAKAELAVESVKQFNLDEKFGDTYSETIPIVNTYDVTGDTGNKFLKLLK